MRMYVQLSWVTGNPSVRYFRNMAVSARIMPRMTRQIIFSFMRSLLMSFRFEDKCFMPLLFADIVHVVQASADSLRSGQPNLQTCKPDCSTLPQGSSSLSK